ncbi:MAG: ferric reductase-like transmembrane domain-containing protein [Thermoleophilia bacterium]
MSGQTLWYISRAGGFVAFGLITLSVALGLITSMRLSTPRWPRAITSEMHRFVTITGLVFTGLHVVTLMLHPTEGLSLLQVLVPGTVAKQTLAVSLGVVAMELLVALWLSTYLRSRIGYRRWRQLHYLTFGAFAVTLLHGLMNGTSTGTPWGRAIYMVCMAVVGGLLAVRILSPHLPPEDADPATSRRAAPGPAPGRAAELPELPPRHDVPSTLPSLKTQADRPL